MRKQNQLKPFVYALFTQKLGDAIASFFRKRETCTSFPTVSKARKINGQTCNKISEIQAQLILNPLSFKSKKKRWERKQEGETMIWLQ